MPIYLQKNTNIRFHPNIRRVEVKLSVCYSFMDVHLQKILVEVFVNYSNKYLRVMNMIYTHTDIEYNYKYH